MLRKGIRIFSVVCLAGVLVAWFALGANLGWTKTSVATQHVDEITGIEFPIFENRFVPGVEFLALGIGGAIVLAALSFLPNLKKHNP